jgi:GcrA cell cycle regulator
MSSTSWTDERVGLLTQLWSEGLSASEIAKRLGGLTRNAVLGKLHRLGRLGGRPKSSPPAKAAPMKRMLRNRRTTAPAQVRSRAPRQPEPDWPPMVLAVEQLTPWHCRWPVGDPARPGFGFCGRAASAGPYCREHQAVAFVRPRERRVAERAA